MRAPVPLVECRRHATVTITPAAVPPASPEEAAYEEEEEQEKENRENREEPESPRPGPDVHVLCSSRRCGGDSAALDDRLSHTCIVGADANRSSTSDNQRAKSHR